MLLNEPTPHTVLTITEEAKADAPASAEAETKRLDVIGVAATLSAPSTGLDSAGSTAEREPGEPSSPAGSGEIASSADADADANAETTVSGEAVPSDSDPDSGDSVDGSDSVAASAPAGSAGPTASPDSVASRDSVANRESAAAAPAEGPPSADTPTVSLRRPSTAVALPETVAEVVAVVDAASRAIAAAEDAARIVAAAHERAAARRSAPPPVLDLREPAQPAPVDGLLDLLAPVLERPLLVVEQPALPSAPDLMALHRAEFELDFAEPPVVAAGDEPPIPVRFGPGLAVLPHIEFPV